MISALYVVKGGPYYGLAGVDPWDLERDARKYPGPWPVVAHPPCERWGRYWSGGPSAKTRRRLGDDNGCFAAALTAVRDFGGVIEHPEASHAWRTFQLPVPKFNGGWTALDLFGGSACCVSQGHYGHRARKMTWLYVVSKAVILPELIWGPAKDKTRMDLGFHSAEERRRAIRTGVGKRLSKRQRLITPDPFRDLLISIAQGSMVSQPGSNEFPEYGSRADCPPSSS